jgi:hypothetical protein
MAPTDGSGASTWAIQHVLALVEIWALIAEHSGLVGAWQLTGVCRTARAGAREWLCTLPGWVVTGGYYNGPVSEVWRLDLVTLQWGPMPTLVTARYGHASCTVRGALVVLGGYIEVEEDDIGLTSSVEILSGGARDGVFTSLPPLSCGGIADAAAIVVEESTSAAGQVLLLGGFDEQGVALSTVHLVDLATGTCTPQPALSYVRGNLSAARLPDGRIVCAGGYPALASSEVLGPPGGGASNAAWTWTQLPAMNVWRHNCCGCVMSNGCFAILGGSNYDGETSSCESLMVGEDAHWEPLHPLHHERSHLTCAAVARCILVVGEHPLSTEVYDEALNRWVIRLPCDLPGDSRGSMSSALM